MERRLVHRQLHSRYPAEIAKLLKEAATSPWSGGWHLGGTEVNSTTGKHLSPVDTILLAGATQQINDGRLDWHEAHADPEDEEALHRWNWILRLLSDERVPQEHLCEWVTEQLVSWFDTFLAELHSPLPGSLRWTSYTVGERIANAVIFYYCMGRRPPARLLTGLHDLTKFLLPRFEYLGSRTGNHVVNNARAVYLAGVALNVEGWKRLASGVLALELDTMVTPDGFLREGSSHYQLLFTRWVLEVLHFAQRDGDQTLVDLLSPRVKSLIKNCRFFVADASSDSVEGLALFGDLSPDFPPGWLLKVLRSCLSPGNSDGTSPFSSVFGTGIGSLCWDSDGNGSSGEDQSCAGSFPNSGWFRVDHAGHTLICRADSRGVPRHVGHHHDDLCHFSLHYRGRPVLIEGGRRNYMPDDPIGRFGLSAASHNATLIDGLGLLPQKWYRYPRAYAESECRVAIEEQTPGSVQVRITAHGFRRLLAPVDYMRTIHLSDRSCWIHDRFEGKGTHDIESFFHLSPNATMEGDDKSWGVVSPDYAGTLQITAGQPLSVTLERGGESPLGWTSMEYGRLEPAPTLAIRARVSLPFEIDFLFSWEQ